MKVSTTNNVKRTEIGSMKRQYDIYNKKYLLYGVHRNQQIMGKLSHFNVHSCIKLRISVNRA